MSEWDGMPLNPERDGWHWMHDGSDKDPLPMLWHARGRFFVHGDTVVEPEEASSAIYLGPCALPSDLAAAVEAEREACAAVARDACLVPPDGGSPTEDEVTVCEEAALRIRARSTSPSALAEHTARVRREAIEQCANVLMRCPHDMGTDREMGPIGCSLDLRGDAGCVCRHAVVAIRALLTEADDAAG